MHKKKLRTIITVCLTFVFFRCVFLQSILYADKLDDLITSLVSETKEKSIRKIAVFNFIDITSKQRFLLSDILEEDLTTKIIQTKKFDVIVKSRISEILKELKFGYEGFVEPEKRKQFGKLSQADAILTGTYREKGKKVLINAQLINVETGEAIWAGSVLIPRNEFAQESFQFPNIYQKIPTITSVERKNQVKPKSTGAVSIISQSNEAEIYLDAKRIVGSSKHFPPKEEYKLTKKYAQPDGLDIYLSYITFSPMNNTFNKIIGQISGPYIGMDIASIVGIGIDSWVKDGLSVSDIIELSASALNLTLTYPYTLSENFLIYGGVGARFESISVNSYLSSGSDVEFGNNGLIFTVGAKLRFCNESKNGSSYGVEFNYSLMAANYTSYSMFRIGVLYGLSAQVIHDIWSNSSK